MLKKYKTDCQHRYHLSVVTEIKFFAVNKTFNYVNIDGNGPKY